MCLFKHKEYIGSITISPNLVDERHKFLDRSSYRGFGRPRSVDYKYLTHLELIESSLKTRERDAARALVGVFDLESK